MSISPGTLEILRHLASKPGHDEVKADFSQLLVEEFDADRASLRFEKRQPEIYGRLDALIGRTVLEAKRDLDRELPDVIRRMPDYLADCEREHGEPFVGIASDGRRWIVYELSNGQLVTLKEAVLDPEQGETFLAWLDGVVALKGSLPPDGLTIRNELGPDSIAFKRVDRELRALWDEVSSRPAEALKRQLWADMLKLVYGREVEDQSLWFRHSYLVIVTKCIALAVMDLQIPPSGNTPDAVRENLHRVLAFVRAAEAMPWDARDLRYYSGLVPYMAEWLKNGEGDSLMAQFKAEMDRLQAPDDQVAPNWRRIWGIAA